MRIVSPLLKKVVYPVASRSGAFRVAAGRGLAVVTYHGVLPEGYRIVDSALDGNLIRGETLRRQLRLLKINYDVISPADVLAWLEGRGRLPARAVLITCDDGLLNNLTDMLPVLREEDVKCLFFVTAASASEQRKTLWYEELFVMLLNARSKQSAAHARNAEFKISHGNIEIRGPLQPRDQMQAAWWAAVKLLSQFDADSREAFFFAASEQMNVRLTLDEAPVLRRFGLMTANELWQLASAGMSIGAHTLSHPVLSQMPVEQAQWEISESRKCLESAIEQKVWAFAYPFGDAQSVTPAVLAMPRDAGFAAAFLNYGGGLASELPPYAMPRIHVTSDMSVAELEAYVSGFYGRLRRMVSM